jgi:hypothetical protein
MDWEKKSEEIKGKTYILQETKVYVKTKKGTKGEQYGIYTNYKLKKLASPKEIKVYYFKYIVSKTIKRDL